MITIRPLQTNAERERFFRLAAETFSSDSDPASAGPGWQAFVEDSPEYDLRQVRGAFRG